jgi:hypothetical protein
MLSDFSDLKAQIAEWANRKDWSDGLVTSFVRMAEQKFNQELRVSRMIHTVENVMTDRCAVLPDDWLEMELVRIANPDAADGFSPIRYKDRDTFFNTRSIDDARNAPWYTIEGREIAFGGPPTTDGTVYRITYFAEVPQMSDSQDSWVYDKYPMLYLSGALMHSNLHAIGEEQTAADHKQLTEDMIAKLNAEYLRSKASGSRLSQSRRRSFG